MEKTTQVIIDGPPKRWYQKRNVLIDVAVIAAVFIIIAVVWWVGHRPKPAEAPKVTQYTGQALVNAVNERYGAHDYVGAVRLVQGQKTINDKSTQLVLAGAYANQGDYQKSLEVYEKLDKQKPLGEVDAATAGHVAEQAKQYQKAIDFYNEAKKQANANNPDQIATYEYQIGELQKKL